MARLENGRIWAPSAPAPRSAFPMAVAMLPITWRSTPTYVDLPKEGQYPKLTVVKPSAVLPKICFSFWSSGPSFWPSGPSFWSSGPSFWPFGPLFWSSGPFWPFGPLFWSSRLSFWSSGPAFWPSGFSFWPFGPLFWSSGPSFWPFGPLFWSSRPSFWFSGPLFWPSGPFLGLHFGLHFGLLGLHFGLWAFILGFWAFILALWAFILAFCAFILAFWAFILVFGASFWSLGLMALWAFILAFCAFILAFWPSGPSFWASGPSFPGAWPFLLVARFYKCRPLLVRSLTRCQICVVDSRTIQSYPTVALCKTALPTNGRCCVRTRLGRSAPSALCRRMLPGCPNPRPPSCTGRGWLVGPPPTEDEDHVAPGKNTKANESIHIQQTPLLFVCCLCHPSVCPCVLCRPPIGRSLNPRLAGSASMWPLLGRPVPMGQDQPPWGNGMLRHPYR